MDKIRILIVDDEPHLTRLLKLNLEETGGYEVQTENRGPNALLAAKAFRPDLIFLDFMMPETDGGEVVAQLKEEEELRDIPVVFLTAIISKDEAITGRAAVVGYPFLAKPTTMAEVISCIEQHRRASPSR